MRNRILAMVAALILAFSNTVPVFATPIADNNVHSATGQASMEIEECHHIFPIYDAYISEAGGGGYYNSYTWKVLKSYSCNQNQILYRDCMICGERQTLELPNSYGHQIRVVNFDYQLVYKNYDETNFCYQGQHYYIVCQKCGEILYSNNPSKPVNATHLNAYLLEDLYNNPHLYDCIPGGRYRRGEDDLSHDYINQAFVDTYRNAFTITLPSPLPAAHVLGYNVPFQNPSVENYVAPTHFTEGGYDTVTRCTRGPANHGCNYEIINSVHTTLPVTDHIPGEPVIENEISEGCMTNGSYDTVIYCTEPGCGYEISRVTTVIPGHDHNYVETTPLAPTCTETGIRLLTCSYDASHTIQYLWPRLGHSYEEKSEITTQPTCSTEGALRRYKECSTCNNVVELGTDTLDELGHISGTPVMENRVEPTCDTAGGYDIVVYCEREENGCNHAELSRQHFVLPATDHRIETTQFVIENNIPATCTEDGSYDVVYYCLDCGEEVARNNTTVIALNHDWELVSSAETFCVKDGFEDYVCRRDNSHIKHVTWSNPDAHNEASNYFVSEIVTEPTCTDAGSLKKTFICNNTNADVNPVVICNHVVKTSFEDIEVLGHISGAPVIENKVEPTTEKDGGYDEVIYCTRENCGSEISRVHHVIDRLVPEHTHDYTHITYKGATCEEQGYEKKECECGDIVITYTNPLGHIEGTFAVENLELSTCVTRGSYEKVVRCTRDANGCGHKVLSSERIEISALGHEKGAPVIENKVEPTTESEGGYDEVTYCVRGNGGCGNTELYREHFVIEKLTPDHVHTYSAVETKNAACLEEGYVKYSCDCGDSYIESRPSLGHIEGTPVKENYVKATATKDGGYDLVTYCDRDANGCSHMELYREHIVLEKEKTPVAVVVASVAALTGGSSGFVFFIFFRRRKVKGILHGTNLVGYRITLEGKDILEATTDSKGEFLFKNLKKDVYALNIYSPEEELVFSCNIFTDGKRDEEVFTLIKSEPNAAICYKNGQTFAIELNV